MKLVYIKNDNSHLLKNFVDNIGIASKSFRYFNKRSVDVINNHLITLLLLENEVPVAYGHLEAENEIVWLGICVLPPFSGKGFGKSMMNALIENAKTLRLNCISLTVDKDNKAAIKLYAKYNFKQVEDHTSYFKFILPISY